MDFKYSGIILSKRDVSETDRIYTIFTLESGKIKALGKGVRRPNAKLAGHLEPITYSEIFLSKGRGIGKLTGSGVVENFPKIKADIEALIQVSSAVKVLEKIIPEQQAEEKTFQLFSEYLNAMEDLSGKNNPGKKAGITLGFFFKLLEESGYKLEIKRCVICGGRLQSGNNSFSASRGGVLCCNCQSLEQKKIRVVDSSIKFMRIFAQNKIGNLEKLSFSQKDLDNLRKIIKESLDWMVK